MVPSVGPTGPGGSFLALAQLFAENGHIFVIGCRGIRLSVMAVRPSAVS